eukprot:g36342.t1
MYPAVRFHGGVLVSEKQGKRCLRLKSPPSAQQPPEIEIKSMTSQEPGHLQRSKHPQSYFQIATSQPMMSPTQTQALPRGNLAVKHKSVFFFPHYFRELGLTSPE